MASEVLSDELTTMMTVTGEVGGVQDARDSRDLIRSGSSKHGMATNKALLSHSGDRRLAKVGGVWRSRYFLKFDIIA
jgi:hypothetical protein